MMGNSYANITLTGPGQSEIARYLDTGRYVAWISPTLHERTAVFEEHEAGEQEIFDLAAGLSAHFHCPALAIVVYDSDILYSQLFENGVLTDIYNSHPSFMVNEPPRPPEGGDAHRLCAAFGLPEAEATVERILRHNWFEDDSRYLFAEDRHDDLTRALNLPPFVPRTGYSVIKELWDDEDYAGFVVVGFESDDAE
jgi:hypothetical protein